MSNSNPSTRNRNHNRGRNLGSVNSRSNNNNGNRRSEPREPKPERGSRPGIYGNPRMMHCYAAIVGSQVTVKMKNGREFVGLFTSVNHECDIVLSAVNTKEPEKSSSQAEKSSSQAEKSSSQAEKSSSQVVDQMVINRESMVNMEVLNVEMEFKRDFATDGVIAQRHNGQIQEKQLQPWVGADDDPPIEETLESSTENGWEATDMFKTNAEKFNLESTYDPNMMQYTTPLPTVRDEAYRKREQMAEKLTQEIEEDDQSKRQSELENGEEDEEAKYSAVVRGPQSKARAYVVPQKRPGGVTRGGRQGSHMDGGGRGPQHTRSGPQTHSQPPTPRTPPKMDANNPSRQNGNENRAERSQSVAEVSTASGPQPSSMGQGPLPMPHQAQAQALQPTPGQVPPSAPGAMAQARPPPPQSLSQAQPAQPQSMPPTTIQAPTQAPSQAVPVAAAVLGGGDGVQEAPTQASAGQTSATAGAPVTSRNNKAVEDLKKFQTSFNLKCQESETKAGEAAGGSAPKETAAPAAAKEEEPAEKELDTEGDKPVQQKSSSLNPNALEFIPQAQQAQQAGRPAHTSSPVVMPPHQQQFMGNPQAFLFSQPQPQAPRNNQYHHTKRVSVPAVVSLAQPPRQDFTAAAQHATGQPLLAQPAPMPNQYNQPYIMPQFQQNLQMVPHATRMNQTSLTHQSLPGGDPMQASSQHGMNPQHMFVAPPQHGPMPAHLPSHLGPMPAHVTHPMATGQQSTAVQQMTPVTGPPNPNSVQHGVGHQQPPPSSGTPQPGQMSYAQINLPNRLGHQNQHATSPQPMQHYGMATSHAQPQQHMQGAGGPQYTFTQQSQPASSQAMQQYPHTQHGHHPQAHLVVMPPPQPLQGHMQTQFPSHPMPMPAHTPAPVIPMQQGIPVSGASGLQHHHMPYVHTQVASQHTHQVQGYHQTQ